MMKKLKTRLGAATIAITLGIGGTLIAAAPANAVDYGVNMHDACALQHGAGWQAKLLDAGNAYSWRCWVPPWGNPGAYRSVNINLYCELYFGGYAVVLNPSNAYSWRCRV